MRERIQELDAFAVRMAHDVRGPLATPVMALDILSQDASFGAAQRDLIDRARRSIGRSVQIVDGLLAYARAKGAVDAENRVHSKLVESISGMRDEFAQNTKEAAIRLEVEHIDDVEVACAPGVLASLLSNLVSNAIRYMGSSTERKITLRSRLRGEMIRIEVEDTGPGLSQENMKNLFEPYIRGSNANVPGLGLGLATVHRLVRAHGGVVGVNSRPGRGSLFWFELPIAGPVAG
jgi:signal transduction histidine kinase